MPAAIAAHDLRFHKRSIDGSGKANAYWTGDDTDQVFGGGSCGTYTTTSCCLDEAEGLGHGYTRKVVRVVGLRGVNDAYIYVATPEAIDPGRARGGRVQCRP